MVYTTSGGPLNPSYALSLHIWDLIYYNNNNHVNNDPLSEMLYVTLHVGRYNWVYIMAPIMGGAIAGYCARLYEDRILSQSIFEQVPESRAGTVMEKSNSKDVDLLE